MGTTTADVKGPTTRPAMMSMQPSGSTRRSIGRRARRLQAACTHGASAGGGGRSA